MALIRAWVGLEIVAVVDEDGARRRSRLPCALVTKLDVNGFCTCRNKADSLRDLFHRSERLQPFILYPSFNRLLNPGERDPHGALVVYVAIEEEGKGPVGEEWCGIGNETKLNDRVKIGFRLGLVGLAF
jgi:hypothetical protein